MSAPISFMTSLGSSLSHVRTGSLPCSVRKNRHPSFGEPATTNTYRFRYGSSSRYRRREAANAFVAQLTELKSREGARKSNSAETAHTRDVLQARPSCSGGGLHSG